AVGLGGTIDDLQFFDPVLIVIGKKQLVRRMNFNQANAEADNLLHICQNIVGMPRMQAAAGDEPLGIFLNVVGNECVDLGGEADDLRRHIINEYGAIDAALVQIF